LDGLATRALVRSLSSLAQKKARPISAANL
jgi:hypothetical protein